MSSVYEEMAADKIGPLLGGPRILVVTTSPDKIQIFGTGGILPKAEGRMIYLISTVSLAYAWFKDGSGTIDYNATSGATTGLLLPAGVPEEQVSLAPWLYWHGTGAGKLWVSVSSTKTRNSQA